MSDRALSRRMRNALLCEQNFWTPVRVHSLSQVIAEAESDNEWTRDATDGVEARLLDGLATRDAEQGVYF